MLSYSELYVEIIFFYRIKKAYEDHHTDMMLYNNRFFEFPGFIFKKSLSSPIVDEWLSSYNPTSRGQGWEMAARWVGRSQVSHPYRSLPGFTVVFLLNFGGK